MRETAGQKIKQFRIKSKKSGDDMADLLKMSYHEYIMLEHDTTPTTDRKIIEKLCIIFKCRDTDILKG